mmetsp:Transcript_3805/g.5838  ORF Transcript_3805/g.5838 Transcript_3805/m.5838 type:complete len:80 (-) Transcript_3805:33-272(-)
MEKLKLIVSGSSLDFGLNSIRRRYLLVAEGGDEWTAVADVRRKKVDRRFIIIGTIYLCACNNDEQQEGVYDHFKMKYVD